MITDSEGMSVREAVDWCGSGLTVREVTPATSNGATTRRTEATDERV